MPERRREGQVTTGGTWHRGRGTDHSEDRKEDDQLETASSPWAVGRAGHLMVTGNNQSGGWGGGKHIKKKLGLGKQVPPHLKKETRTG